MIEVARMRAIAISWTGAMVVERIQEVGIARHDDGAAPVQRVDRVAAEEPLEIRLNGEALAVIMRTPGDDIHLAAGFLCAEEIVTSADDIGTIAHCKSGTDPNLENVVNVTLTPERRASADAMLAQRKAERATITSASCGVCGKKTIESLATHAKAFEREPVLDPALIGALPKRLRAAQEVFDATGGLHGAAIFSPDGKLLVVKEDVGRHNAVDKCVGALLLSEVVPFRGVAPHVLMVSGRTSFEIVQKALVAGVQIVAAVSAPSSLAVDLARNFRMGLVGFVRDGGFNVYSGVLASNGR
jgi:FdhD protein